MKLHGGKPPAKKKTVKKRLKPIIKRIIHPGAVAITKQARVLQEALGWMDTAQFQTLAAEVVKRIHEAGFRIATKGPKLNIQTNKERLAAQAAENRGEL